jgi:hypothetical protein
MTGGYFNEYHLQFLKLFVERGVRFLIIGGQARAAHHGTRTRDLDVWVDISVANRPSIDNALFAWAAKYPTHSASSFSPPLQLRPNVQIKFPDAEVLFLGADGEPHEIGPEDCIDVLTSIGSADFVEHYARAEWRDVAGLHLPFLALTDLDTISPAKRAI